jgi:hypothetical protein
LTDEAVGAFLSGTACGSRTDNELSAIEQDALAELTNMGVAGRPRASGVAERTDKSDLSTPDHSNLRNSSWEGQCVQARRQKYPRLLFENASTHS